MIHEASYHEGYSKALEAVRALLEVHAELPATEVERLLDELDRRIEKARCLGHSSLAAGASGTAGY